MGVEAFAGGASVQSGPRPSGRATTARRAARENGDMANEASVHPGQLDGRPNLTLTDADGTLEATYLPSLGMVACSLLHEDEQVLELLGGPAAYEARGSSFGIPLLHPWANRLDGFEYEVRGRRVRIDPDSPRIHRDANGLPIHGLLAAHPGWTVLEAAASGDTARLRAQLDFGAHPDLLDAFPFPHRLGYDAGVVASRLRVRLTVTPTADVAVPISFGLHPYLRLPRTDRRRWTIEMPVRRRVVLDARGLPTGEFETLAPGALSGPLADRTFDDCFDRLDAPPGGGPIVFSLQDERRRVSVELVEGYDVAQVFAPAGSDFICFEPMTAPVNALADGRGLRFAEPGEPFSAEFAIAAQSLNG
jgi:galactose mutarotase-like enzyme